MARYLFVFVLFALKPCNSWHGPGSEACVDTTDSEEEDTTGTSQGGDDASIDAGGDAGAADASAADASAADASAADARADDSDEPIDVDTVDNVPENEGVTDASALD